MIRMIKQVALLSSCVLAFSTLTIAQEQNQDTEDADTSSNSGLTITTDGVTTTSTNNGSDNNIGTAYVCTLNGVQRRVEIDLLNSPAPVPCEVNYYKDNEAPGAKTTLWSAQNDSFYCENQAKAFIKKLESMNWSCSGS